MTTQTNTAAPQLVQITERAQQEVKRLIADQPVDQQGLRLGVQGGGCSGLSYKLTFDAAKEKDYVSDVDGIQVLIDPKSAIYLKGLTVDYQGGLEGKGFVFMNPNAASTCGCGESFTVV